MNITSLSVIFIIQTASVTCVRDHIPFSFALSRSLQFPSLFSSVLIPPYTIQCHIPPCILFFLFIYIIVLFRSVSSRSVFDLFMSCPLLFSSQFPLTTRSISNFIPFPFPFPFSLPLPFTFPVPVPVHIPIPIPVSAPAPAPIPIPVPCRPDSRRRR